MAELYSNLSQVTTFAKFELKNTNELALLTKYASLVTIIFFGLESRVEFSYNNSLSKVVVLSLKILPAFKMYRALS